MLSAIQDENDIDEVSVAEHKKVKLTDEIKSIVNTHIKDDWSPEQVAGQPIN
jgi:IS30 family transposase